MFFFFEYSMCIYFLIFWYLDFFFFIGNSFLIGLIIKFSRCYFGFFFVSLLYLGFCYVLYYILFGERFLCVVVVFESYVVI